MPVMTVERCPKPNFGNVKYRAIVAGEVVGNGDTKQAATDNAIALLYRGYAMTYPHRVELRALGADWDRARKVWLVPDERADEARALVSGGGGTPAGRPAPYRGRLTRYGSGRGYLGTDRYGRAHFGAACGCEDYPCCGCGQ